MTEPTPQVTAKLAAERAAGHARAFAHELEAAAVALRSVAFEQARDIERTLELLRFLAKKTELLAARLAGAP